MNALRRRSARVLPATISGIIIVAVAGGVIWAGIYKLVSGQWWPPLKVGMLEATRAPWTATWALGTAVVIALAGLILVLSAILPGRFSHARMRAPEPEADAVRGRFECVMTTGGLATLASSISSRIDGVSAVRSSASARSIVINLTTPLRSTGPLVEQTRRAIQETMREWGVDPMPRVKVHARTKGIS